jgi:hypothetical protein
MTFYYMKARKGSLIGACTVHRIALCFNFEQRTVNRRPSIKTSEFQVSTHGKSIEKKSK